MFSDNDLLFNIPEPSILGVVKGSFSKPICLVIYEEPNSPENTIFLKKIMEAVGLDLEKDTLYCIVGEGDQYTILPIIKSKQAECILVFGLRPEQLGLQLNCTPYTPFDFYGVRFLFSDKLSKVQADTTLKRNLWQALQQLNL